MGLMSEGECWVLGAGGPGGVPGAGYSSASLWGASPLRCRALGDCSRVLDGSRRVLGGIHRLGYEPPARTPGSVAVIGCGTIGIFGRSWSWGAALWPRASMNARRTASCTCD